MLSHHLSFQPCDVMELVNWFFRMLRSHTFNDNFLETFPENE